MTLLLNIVVLLMASR